MLYLVVSSKLFLLLVLDFQAVLSQLDGSIDLCNLCLFLGSDPK